MNWVKCWLRKLLSFLCKKKEISSSSSGDVCVQSSEIQLETVEENEENNFYISSKELVQKAELHIPENKEDTLRPILLEDEFFSQRFLSITDEEHKTLSFQDSLLVRMDSKKERHLATSALDIFCEEEHGVYAPSSTNTHSQIEYAQKTGEQGERISNFIALPIVRYGKQLRNLYIPKANGTTTEIDTLVISVSGIYVIETKNYHGWVYGDQFSNFWTVTYSREKKYSVYNPIKQNETHIRALQQLLPSISYDSFFSLIVFGNTCQMRKVSYNSPQTFVMKHCELEQRFKNFLIENEGRLPRDKVNEIFNKLKQYTNVSEEVKLRHIASIRERSCSKKVYS